VGAWLAGILADERLPVETRLTAFGPFRHDWSAGRLGQRAALAGLLQHHELRLAVDAAWTLVGGGDYDEAVRAAVAGWPADAPYPASEVRRELDEADELASARRVLAGRAERNATPDPLLVDAVRGALGAVREYGDDSDLPELMGLLADTDMVIALVAAGYAEDVVKTIGGCLRDCEQAASHGAALAGLFADEARPSAVRAMAIQLLRWPDVPLGQEDALAGLLGHDDLRLATEAARTLVERDGYRDLVRTAAAGWPADTPDPAAETRQMLAEADELAQARQVLATAAQPGGLPLDPVSLCVAPRVVTEHGDQSDRPLLFAVVDGADLAALLTDEDPIDLADALVSALCEHMYSFEKQACQQVGIRLAALFADERLPAAVRDRAIRPFWRIPPRYGQEQALSDLLRRKDLPLELAVAAAYALLGLADHDALVRQTVDTWPADAPPPADRIRTYYEGKTRD
jgi:hypothetical protein